MNGYNPKEAVNWFRKAATQGFAEGQYQLGKAYFLGEGIEQDQPMTFWLPARFFTY